MNNCANGMSEQKAVKRKEKRKGLLKEEELEIIDMKRRCDAIQEKLRKLSCISVDEDNVRQIKSVFREESRDRAERGVGGNYNGNNTNNDNDNGYNSNNNNNSNEEDNLSDLANELVEVFELDKKETTAEDDLTETMVKTCESGIDNGKTTANDNKELDSVMQQEEQEDHLQQDNKVIIDNTTHNTQEQPTKPILIQEQPSHGIIEITSTQPPLTVSSPHFTSAMSIVSQVSTTIPANVPSSPSKPQLPVQPELQPDDDAIIKTILETAKISQSPPQAHTAVASSRLVKRVQFDPTKTIIIEYNEHELITHLNVYNAEYLPVRYKPKGVRNYKLVTNNGVKPCISPEYTKFLKLNVKTVPKLANSVVSASKKRNGSNSSRNLASKGALRNEAFASVKRNGNNNSASSGNSSSSKVVKTNNAMTANTSMNKQQVKGQSKGNGVRVDKTMNTSNSKKSNKNANKDKDVIANSKGKQKEHECSPNPPNNNNNNNTTTTATLTEDIDDVMFQPNDLSAQSRRYSL